MVFCWCHLSPCDLCHIFWQNYLMKIHNRGKFHWFSVCSYQDKSFQNFVYWFSIHKMVHMGDRVGLLHPQIWSDFTKIFTRDNILVNISIFAETRWTQNLHFWSNFYSWCQVSPNDGESGRKKNVRKKFSQQGIQICQSQSPNVFSLEMKNRIAFCNFWAFLDKVQGMVKG